MTKARDIASAAPAPSTVSATELGYVDGVTSAIQTQLDAKTAKSTLTTTGDIYYASAANTPARLGIGTASQLLAVNSGATAPEWVAAPSSGGMTLIQETVANNNSSITFSAISGSYKQLILTYNGLYTSSTSTFAIRLNNDSGGNYEGIQGRIGGTGVSRFTGQTDLNNANNGYAVLGYSVDSSTDYSRQTNGTLTFDNYADTTKNKKWSGIWVFTDNTTQSYANYGAGTYKSNTAITSIDIVRVGGSGGLYNNSNTSIRLYGVA